MAEKKLGGGANVPVRAAVGGANVEDATAGGFVTPCKECQGTGGHREGCSQWEMPKQTRRRKR